MKATDKWTFRPQYVKCGKARCKSCPHGPYWYKFKKISGKTKSAYVGKKAPWETQGYTRADDVNRLNSIFHRREATEIIAREILGVPANVTKAEAHKRFKQLVLENHPDRGGDTLAMQRINAAWTFLKVSRGW